MVWGAISLTGKMRFSPIEEMQGRYVARRFLNQQYCTSPQSGNNCCLHRAVYFMTLPRVERGSGQGVMGLWDQLGVTVKTMVAVFGQMMFEE